MKDTDFILAYEQNPLIYDYVYKNKIFYKNNTGKRQYHFPEIDLSINKLDIVDQKINDNSIIYFCMNEFESLINILKYDSNKKYVLLADGGDGNVENLELPDNILHVYCPNLPFYNNKYSPFPRGILKNNYLRGTSNIQKIERAKYIYCNFTVYPYSSNRINDFNYWYNLSKLNDYITIRKTNHADDESYWMELYEHKFNICSSPASDTDKNQNRDTYRLWETLVSGAIPIIKRSKMAEFFYSLNLPILIVDQWEEASLDYLNKILQAFSNKSLEATKEQYWIDKLRGHFKHE
jgi:hypothetical protein